MITRTAVKLGFVLDYELEACAISGGKWGGVRYSHIPNYVYRWTEVEIKKTVNTYMAAYKHRFNFYYGMQVPTDRLAMSPSAFKRLISKASKLVVPIFEKLLPKQCNNLGFAIVKNVELQPWLIAQQDGNLSFDLDYARKRFNVDACNWK